MNPDPTSLDRLHELIVPPPVHGGRRRQGGLSLVFFWRWFSFTGLLEAFGTGNQTAIDARPWSCSRPHILPVWNWQR
jgi:hypothetical protein